MSDDDDLREWHARRERWEQQMDATIERPFRRTTNASDVLYHYTGEAGFIGIVQSSSLRLTEFRAFGKKGGDEFELQHADALISEVAISLVPEFERDQRAERVLYEFLGSYAEQRLGEAGIEVYVGCFSSTHDNAHLWEQYAAKFKGYCLGIEVLKDEEPVQMEGYKVGPLLDVEYDAASHFERVQTSFREALKQHAQVRRELRVGRYSGRLNGLSPLLRIAAMANLGFKAARYRDEREVRIIVSNEEPMSPIPQDTRDMPLRSQNRPVVLRSVHVGIAAGQAGCELAERFLRRLGYGREGMPPMPMIEISEIVDRSGACDRE